jgi:hypothetical protein
MTQNNFSFDNKIAPHVSIEEYEAQKAIRIAGSVIPFVDYLKSTRSTAGRQLFYDAYSARRNDTDLLKWVRAQAVIYSKQLSNENMQVLTTASN